MSYLVCVLLTVWGVIAAAFGFFTLVASKSAIHEIEAGIAFLIATIAIGLAGVIGALHGNRWAAQKSAAEKQLAVPIPQEF